jgi:arylsulfatase A-like enzyme
MNGTTGQEGSVAQAREGDGTDRPPAAAVAAAVWCILAAVHVVLNALAPGGALTDRLLPAWACGALAGLELAALAVAAYSAARLFALFERLRNRWEPSRRAWIARALRGGAAVLLLFLYAASWGAFWFSGQFLDREGVEFAATNAIAMFGYAVEMHGLLLAILLAAALAAALAVAEGLPRWLAARPPDRLRRLVRVAASLALLCAAGALAGEIAARLATGVAIDPSTGAVCPIADLYRIRRVEAAGPLTHAVLDLVAPPPELSRRAARAAPVRIVRRPLLTREAYLEGADRTALRRPNVIIVEIDSFRADAIRAGGAGRDVMPTIDAIAQEGRVYTDCLTQATHTDYAAPCPLSSQYPLRDRFVHRYPRSPSYPRVLIYDLLKALGYRTAVVSSQDESWGRMIHYLQTGAIDHFFHARTFIEASARNKKAAGVRALEGIIDDRYTVSEAIRWLDAAWSEPFFLYLNLQNAHAPYPIPRDFPRRFGPPAIDFPLHYGRFPPERAGVVKDLYADSLAYVDAQIGWLIDHLRSRGAWDRTIVAVTGDHGEAFYEHGHAAHGWGVYDEIARVPLVLRGPGIPRGIDRRPAQLIDIPPTLLHALGLPPHPGFQGVDLLDPSPRADRLRFALVRTPQANQMAVVRAGWKLIHDAPDRRALLYDLAGDPAEKIDLSTRRPDIRAELEAILSAWYWAQIEYYEDRRRHAAEYPPVVEAP